MTQSQLYIWWEQRRFVYDEDLNERSFIGDTVTRRKSEDGFRENYVQAIYIIDNMSHAIGDVFIKSLIYGIHNEQFKRSGIL